MPVTKYLVRLSSDLAIKSDKVRARFTGRLIRNLNIALTQSGGRSADRLDGHPFTIERTWSRIYVQSSNPQLAEILTTTFGVHSISPIVTTLDAIPEDMVQAALAAYLAEIGGRTFAVRVKRTGDHLFSSNDIERRVGHRLCQAGGKVNLKNPEITVPIEIRGQEAHILGPEIPGPRGLPLGVGGKALCLFSGGFDSTIAAWLTQKRGVELDFVFFNLAGDTYLRQVLKQATQFTKRWSTGSKPRFYIIDFRPVAREIRNLCPHALAQVILKRMFYRVSARLAQDLGSLALVTGENLGQVSSQTLHNLHNIEHGFEHSGQDDQSWHQVARPLILRPLITYEKDEIITMARTLGTYAASCALPEFCQLTQERPATRASLHATRRGESQIDPQILQHVYHQKKCLILRDITVEDLTQPALTISKAPENAVIFDLRDPTDNIAPSIPGAIPKDPYQLEGQLAGLDRGQTYVLYCSHGLQSALIAQSMRKVGLDAYSLGVISKAQSSR